MDLNLEDVAELLNISETTLERWIKEGNIPCYQIGGEAKFNRREIEDWVMNRQGLEGASFPDGTEGTLRGTLHFSLYRAIHKGGVLRNIEGPGKEAVIRTSMRTIAKDLDLDAEVLTELLLDREALQPTALNHGIGIPHTRDFLLHSHYDVVTVVFPDEPLEYGALDGEPVHTLFFLFACDDKRHLNLLAKIAHFNSDPAIREFLKERPSQHELLEKIKVWESALKSSSRQLV